MSKLFKLKKWLTIPEAARRLAAVFHEEVTEAAVLRLALDGHLQLSVNFVNFVHARPARFVPISGTHKEVTTFEGIDIDPLDGVSEVLEIDEKVVHLSGVYDLSMVGGERIVVENAHQNLTNGPPIRLLQIDGTYVTKDGELFQLQERFDDSDLKTGLNAQFEGSKQEMTNQDFAERNAKAMPVQHKSDKTRNVSKTRSQLVMEKYRPARRLPIDGVLVVRTEALTKFEGSLDDAQVKVEKPLQTNERNTLLVIIAALCKESKIDYQKPGAAKSIEALIEGIGAKVTEETILAKLKMIPEALESRMK